MDQLAPLLNQTSLSARVFFSGELCEIVNFDESALAGHIHLVKSGNLALSIRQRQVAVIDKPSVLFFPRPCGHTIQPVDQNHCDLLCASIDLGVNVRSPLAMALPEALIIPLDEMSAVSPTLDMLFDEAFSDYYGRQSALNRLAEYFLIQILRHVITHGKLQGGIFSALAEPRLAKAVNAMHDKPGFSWTLESLADEAGMSRARFAVNFREKVGMTPLEYLTDWRISVAQKLLLQGKPINSVAFSVGYQSHAALSRMFTKKLGYSPKDWLAKNSD